jgi:hypothetical protein
MDSYSFQNKPLYYSYHQGFLSKTPLTLVKTIHRFMVSHEQTLNPDYEKSLHPAVGPVRTAVHLFACLPGSCQAKRRLTRPPPRSSALASSSSLFPRCVVLCRSPALLYRLVPWFMHLAGSFPDAPDLPACVTGVTQRRARRKGSPASRVFEYTLSRLMRALLDVWAGEGRPGSLHLNLVG